LGATAALLSTPAHGQIFTGVGCGGTYPDIFTPLFPPDQFNIPVNGQAGDFFGPWYSNSNLGNSLDGFPFFICAPWNAARNNNTGSMDNVYVEGLKPAAVYPSAEFPSKDGQTVFTTLELSEIGVGFIVGWRVHAQDSNVASAWRTPPPNWTVDNPPLADGLPFYRVPSYTWAPTYGNTWLNPVGSDNFSSVAGYRAAMDAVPTERRGTVVVLYGAQVTVRYLLTRPASTIYSALDNKSGSITTDFVILRARPQSHQINHVTVSQTTTFQLPPTSTCETPSWDGMIVHFPMILPSQIPNPGDTTAEKTLDNLTFIRCPRTNLSWYVHANGKWVDSAQGIVGLSGSTPNANPVDGNPRGFGVQLEHGSGSIDGSGPVHINLNAKAPGDFDNVYGRTPAQGVDTNTGVIHTISLRARIIRTSPASEPIISGPFTTSVVIAIQYP